jgi:hypothetical protein
VQAASLFMTGATALQTNIAWLAPVAIILAGAPARPQSVETEQRSGAPGSGVAFDRRRLSQSVLQCLLELSGRSWIASLASACTDHCSAGMSMPRRDTAAAGFRIHRRRLGSLINSAPRRE